MSFDNETKLSEVFKACAEKNGPTINDHNHDVTIKEMQSELNLVLEEVFSSWYENRVMKIKSLRGVARFRFIGDGKNAGM